MTTKGRCGMKKPKICELCKNELKETDPYEIKLKVKTKDGKTKTLKRLLCNDCILSRLKMIYGREE